MHAKDTVVLYRQILVQHSIVFLVLLLYSHCKLIGVGSGGRPGGAWAPHFFNQGPGPSLLHSHETCIYPQVVQSMLVLKLPQHYTRWVTPLNELMGAHRIKWGSHNWKFFFGALRQKMPPSPPLINCFQRHPLGRIGSCLRPGMVRGPGPVSFLCSMFMSL